jgi:hypothetical protein
MGQFSAEKPVLPGSVLSENQHRATLYRLIEQNKLATLKIGARRLVPVGSIDALLKGGAQ